MTTSPVPLNLSKSIRQAIIAALGPATDRSDMLRYAREAIEQRLNADGHPVKFPRPWRTLAPGTLREARGDILPGALAAVLGCTKRYVDAIEHRERLGTLKPATKARYLAALAECRAVERSELAKRRKRDAEKGERHGKCD